MKEIYKIYFRLVLIACACLGGCLLLHGYNEVEDTFDTYNYVGLVLVATSVGLTVLDEINNNDNK